MQVTESGRSIAATARRDQVMASIGAFMAERQQDQHGSAARLRAYIEAVVEFIESHRAQIKALEQILRDGQAAGEFRDFDPVVMATVVQRAIDALPFLLVSTPNLDCGHYARELVTLFELGIARSGS